MSFSPMVVCLLCVFLSLSLSLSLYCACLNSQTCRFYCALKGARVQGREGPETSGD